MTTTVHISPAAGALPQSQSKTRRPRNHAVALAQDFVRGYVSQKKGRSLSEPRSKIAISCHTLTFVCPPIFLHAQDFARAAAALKSRGLRNRARAQLAATFEVAQLFFRQLRRFCYVNRHLRVSCATTCTHTVAQERHGFGFGTVLSYMYPGFRRGLDLDGI